MTRTLTLYQGADMDPSWDYSDWVEWPDCDFGTRCYNGEATQSSLRVRDVLGETGNEIDLPGGLTFRSIAAHNTITLTEDASGTAKHLWRGWVIPKDYTRGAQKAGRAREVNVSVEDYNAELRGIIVGRDGPEVRPEETDVARAEWVRVTYLNGDPRASTVIGNAYLAAGNTVTMPAKDYEDATVEDVLRDCATAADKRYWVVLEDDGSMELFYDLHGSAAYSSTLAIRQTGDPTEVDDQTTFGPIWDVGPASREDGQQLLSGVKIKGRGDVTSYASHASTVSDHNHFEEVVFDDLLETQDEADLKSESVLTQRRFELRTYSCTIYVPADRVHLIKAGMNITIQAKAIPDADDQVQTRRIGQLKLRVYNPDLYRVELQLDRPLRQGPFGSGTRPIPRPAPIDTAEVPAVPPTPQTSSLTPIDHQQKIIDGVTGSWSTVANNVAKAGIVKSTFEGVGGGCPVGAGPWSGQEDRVAGHAFLVNSVGGAVDHGTLTYPWSYDGQGTQYGPFNVYAVANVSDPPAIDAFDSATLIGSFDGGSGSSPASGTETFTVPGSMIVVGQRVLVIVKPMWTTSGSVCAGTGADGRLSTMPGTGQVQEISGNTASLALFADAGTPAVPAGTGELVPATEFGQDATAGTSDNFMRDDASAGTPELGGVSTVPVDVANEPTVGDILSVTSAPTSTTATAAWKPNLASSVTVTDAAGNFIGGNVEAVLAEVASGGSALDWYIVTDATFGATGDGTTDDTAAIQAAIDAAEAALGGVVYFPPGIYKVTGLNIAAHNVELRGDGKNSRIAMASATGDTVTVDAAAQRQFVAIRDLRFTPSVTRTADAEIAAENFLNLTLENLQFSGVGGQINSCIDLGTTARSNYVVFMRNIHADDFNRFFYGVRVVECQASQMFTDATTAGVDSIIMEGGCEAWLWSQCDFVNSANNDASGTGVCLTIRATDYAAAPPRFNMFSSCYFDSHKNGLVATAGKDITFVNCWFSARPDSGAVVNDAACESFVFTACRFENCGVHGLLLNDGTDHQVIGCAAISNNQQAGGGHGFVASSVTGLVLTGNRAYNRASFGGAQENGLWLVSTTAQFIVKDNDFRGNATGPILNDAGLSSTKIVADNLPAGWTSYTPTWSVDGGAAPSLGNGTITGFYKAAGDTIQVYIRLLWGTTTTGGGGNWRFSLPLNAARTEGTGSGRALEDGVDNDMVSPFIDDVSRVIILAEGANVVNATAPFTWGTGGVLNLSITYELA